MLRQPKYKIFPKTNRILSHISKRILKFKKTKWKAFQTDNCQTLLNRNKFVNVIYLALQNTSPDSVTTSFKDGLDARRLIYQLFFNSLNKTNIRKLILSKGNLSKHWYKLVLNLLIKNEFRLDVFLTRLNFTVSIGAAQQLIRQKKILVNNKPVAFPYYLKKYDILSFSQFSLKSNNSKKLLKKNFYSFFELDLYSNNIIITKHLSELTAFDLTLFTSEYISISSAHYSYL